MSKLERFVLAIWMLVLWMIVTNYLGDSMILGVLTIISLSCVGWLLAMAISE